MLTYILIATIVVSLVSFVGLFISSKIISKFIHYLISFAAASLIAVAFFDLIPEGIENSFLTIEQSMIFVVFGIVLFFTIEGMIHWHHCCEGNKSNKKTTSILILAGDFVHNFLMVLLLQGHFCLILKLVF
jgi:zinc transporter ZupT